MTKQLVSKVSGAVVDVIGETDEFWWAKPKEPMQGRFGMQADPFSVPKTHPNWMLYVPVPEVGDVWRSVGVVTEYRVLGVDDKRKLVHWVLADAFHDGDYPIPDPGQVRVTDSPNADIFTRIFPEEYLEFVRKGP